MHSHRPVVLVHGCGGTVESAFIAPGWVTALSAAGRSAIAPNLPGHGDVNASEDPEDYADLAGLLLSRMPEGDFDAVGFSLGAKLLLAIALQFPQRVGKLVLGGIGDNAFAPERIAEAAARALEVGPVPDTPPAVLAFLETWDPDRNNARAIAAILRRPPNPVFTPGALKRITSPILVVNGDQDPVGRNSDQLRASLARARFINLPGVGHFDLTKQDAFIRAAVSFLANDAGSGYAIRKQVGSA